MKYTDYYISPIGEIFLTADDACLTELYFAEQKAFASHSRNEDDGKRCAVLNDAKRWLDVYFSGRKPDFSVPIRLAGTVFQNEVWSILLTIQYGQTTTYGKIAAKIAKERGIERMSPQAVGGAVGHNRISIIVPCHRVIGADGSLTGYAGGIDRKAKLLALEKCNLML